MAVALPLKQLGVGNLGQVVGVIGAPSADEKLLGLPDVSLIVVKNSWPSQHAQR